MRMGGAIIIRLKGRYQSIVGLFFFLRLLEDSLTCSRHQGIFISMVATHVMWHEMYT